MTIDAAAMTTDMLEAYDAMMLECVVKVEKFAPLATFIWSDILKELERRGRVTLAHGSFNDIGNALIHRNPVAP